MNKPSWHDYFMALAFLVAQRSPDPNTKHGAVIVNKHNRILGTGYNGHPGGGRDDSIYDWTSENKYLFSTHAEINSLLNCTQPPCKNSVIYITGKPCNSCALAILQSGIRTVIYGPVECRMDINWEQTMQMFDNHELVYSEYTPTDYEVGDSISSLLHSASECYLTYRKL